MGARDIWFSLKLPKVFWTKLSSNNRAGFHYLDEGDQHVSS